MAIPVFWFYNRRDYLPILEVIGESQAKVSENYMIRKTIEIIESAVEFNGVPYVDYTCPTSDSLITVSFALIFPSQKDLTSFCIKLIDS